MRNESSVADAVGEVDSGEVAAASELSERQYSFCSSPEYVRSVVVVVLFREGGLTGHTFLWSEYGHCCDYSRRLG